MLPEEYDDDKYNEFLLSLFQTKILIKKNSYKK